MLDKPWTELTVTEIGWIVAGVLLLIMIARIIGSTADVLIEWIFDIVQWVINTVDGMARRIWVKIRRG